MIKVITYQTKSIASVLLILGLFAFQSIENTKEEGIKKLKHAIEIYTKAKYFSMDVEYTLFTVDSLSKKMIENGSGRVVRKNDNFYKKELNTTTIVNGNYLMTLNEKAKVISINNVFENEFSSKKEQMDSIAKFIVDVKKINRGYQYFFDKGDTKKIEVLYDKNGFIDTYRTYFRNKTNIGEDRLVNLMFQIRYYNFNTATNLNTADDIFSINKYVIIKGKEVYPKTKYKDYYILNALK